MGGHGVGLRIEEEIRVYSLCRPEVTDLQDWDERVVVVRWPEVGVAHKNYCMLMTWARWEDVEPPGSTYCCKDQCQNGPGRCHTASGHGLGMGVEWPGQESCRRARRTVDQLQRGLRSR